MGSKTLYYNLDTDKPLETVRGAAQRSFAFLGGTMQPRGDGIEITQGVNGVNFAFAANFTALLYIKQTAPGRYELLCSVNWNPNGVFWACLIVGVFVLGILWIVPVLYLFIDPTSAYQQALIRTSSLLD